MYFKNNFRRNDYIAEIKKYAKIIDKKFFVSQNDMLLVNHNLYYKDEKIILCMNTTINNMADDKRTILKTEPFIIHNSNEVERWYIYSQVNLILSSIVKIVDMKEELESLGITLDEKSLLEYIDNYNCLEKDNNIQNSFRNLNFFDMEIPFKFSTLQQKMKDDEFDKKVTKVLCNSFRFNILMEDLFIPNLRELLLETKLNKIEKNKEPEKKKGKI